MLIASWDVIDSGTPAWQASANSSATCCSGGGSPGWTGTACDGVGATRLGCDGGPVVAGNAPLPALMIRKHHMLFVIPLGACVCHERSKMECCEFRLPPQPCTCEINGSRGVGKWLIPRRISRAVQNYSRWRSLSCGAYLDHIVSCVVKGKDRAMQYCSTPHCV